MSNIYEALEQAQRRRLIPDIQPFSRPDETVRSKEIDVLDNSSSLSIESEMFYLYQSVECLLQKNSEKILLFIGPQGEEGVSTIVREFAKMAVSRLNKKVLIMDAAYHNPSQHNFFNISYNYGWKDIFEDGVTVDKAYYKTSDENLYLSPISSQPVLTPHVYDHPAALNFLEELKNKFDLILIDSSPVTTSPDSVAISRVADGVILVIEAERTSSHVIDNVKNRIKRNGGNILGIVFNKRRYYIPEVIYKHLR